MGIVKIEGYKCERCSHLWTGRKKEKPIVCSKCHSPYWNIPKKAKKRKNKNG